MIACLAIPAFSLRAALRRRPDLLGQPVALAPAPGEQPFVGPCTEAAQRAGFVKRYNYVGTGQGTVIRITEFAPGAPKFMHRTETLDYALLLSGECDLELDSGEIVHMEPGDIVVQRGTMHAWVNNGPTPCVFAFILIDAEPAKLAGQELRTHFPAP